MRSWRAYYNLAKPGIVYGNALPLVAGYLLASHRHVNYVTFLAVLIGQSLVIGSACVFNNYIDRDIDAKMDRTKRRELVAGVVPNWQALTLATFLSLAGFALLSLYTNFLTVCIGLIGLISYVEAYTILKRKTKYATLIGAIPGATPPVAGYVAVTNHITSTAIILFLLLVFWQMAHFYSIAIYRLNDYQKAHIPVWPAANGVEATKRQIMFYVVAFTCAAAALTIVGSTSWYYLVASCLLGLYWLLAGATTYNQLDNAKWARGMFFKSLIVLMVICALVSIDAVLH